MKLKSILYTTLIASLITGCAQKPKEKEATAPVSASTNILGISYPVVNPDLSVTVRVNAPDADSVKLDLMKKYPVGSQHSGVARNLTNFGVFVELEPGIDGLVHISDLSWTKKIKHPSEFTEIGAEIDVIVLEIDKDNRRLSLGHKQLEENPWDVFETIFTVDSIHEGTIIEILDKGAVIALPYGVEGFATPKHLVKEDGKQALLEEKLDFKVIEFNKDAKRIILSHSRVFEDEAKSVESAEKKAAKKSNIKKTKAEEVAASTGNEKTTLGDIEGLANLKAQMDEAEKK